MLSLSYHAERARDRLATGAARLVPKWLVRRCLVRAAVHGTTGRYGQTYMSRLTVLQALQRWEKPNA